jgi:hypothetical protein
VDEFLFEASIYSASSSYSYLVTADNSRVLRGRAHESAKLNERERGRHSLSLRGNNCQTYYTFCGLCLTILLLLLYEEGYKAAFDKEKEDRALPEKGIVMDE